MKTRTLIVAAAFMAATSAFAQSYTMQVVLNDGTVHSFDVADVKELKWTESALTLSPDVFNLPDMSIERIAPNLIVSGDNYYVVGGHTTGFDITGVVDRYADGAWSIVDNNVCHDAGSVVTLKDGRKLLIGGLGYGYGTGQSSTVHVFDPAQGTFTQIGSLNTPRALTHSATLEGGEVLVVGNWYASASSAEFYDPDKETFYTVSIPHSTGNCLVFPTKDGGAAVLSCMDNWGNINWSGNYAKFSVAENSFSEKVAEGLEGFRPLPVEDNYNLEQTVTHDARNLFVAFDGDNMPAVFAFDQQTEKFEYQFPLSLEPVNSELGERVSYRSTLVVNKEKHLVHAFLCVNGNASLYELRTYNYDNGELICSYKVDKIWWGTAVSLLPDGNLLIAGGSPNENNFDGSAEAYIVKPL